MKCESCGKTIPNGSAFCNRCGKPQFAPIPLQSPAPATKRTKRGNGFGTVYKRGNTWTAQVRLYRLPPAPDAPADMLNLFSKTKGGFPTRTAALQALPDLRKQLIAKTVGLPKEEQNLTVSFYWGSIQNDVLPRLSKGKQSALALAYKRMKPLWERRVSSLTVADLRNTVSASCKTYYPARDMKTLFRYIFDLAAADGVASRDLPTFIKLPPKQEKEQEAFTPEEAQRIWREWEKGNTFAGYLLLMMTTSMMPGELYLLRKDQIDLDSRVIVGAGIKTELRRKSDIVFPSFMLPVIQSLFDFSNEETLLPKMAICTFRQRYFAVLEAAGCRKLTPYACRHTTATTLALDPELAKASVSKVMRHSEKMTEHYTHVHNAEALETVEHMSRLFTQKPSPTP